MEVEVASARWISSYAGRTFYFCAPGCKRRFERDPSAFQAAVASPIQP
jgi:YHS domain-containing protein